MLIDSYKQTSISTTFCKKIDKSLISKISNDKEIFNLEVSYREKDFLSRKLSNNFNDIIISQMIQSNISKNIILQDTNLINSFILELESKIKEIKSALGYCTFFTFNLGENLFDINQLEKFFSKLSYLLINQNIKILLSIRVPYNNPKVIKNYLKFLLRISNPNILLNLNIHPHEIKDFSNELLDDIKYFIGAIHFIYDSNNYLTIPLIKPWWDYFIKNGIDVPILFAPIADNSAVFAKKIENIKSLFQ